MAAMDQLTTKDLLYPVRNAFHAKVDTDSLMSAMDRNQMLKGKEKKLLKRVDESARRTLLFDKLYSAEQMSAESLVKLFAETENEKNMQFSEVLQSLLSSIQNSAITVATTSVVKPISAAEQVSEQVLTTPSLPPFKYHCPLDDNPSAIFSSTGGVLYLPVYGVTVYIPAGAILGEERVEVSFRLITDEAEIKEFLSHPVFEGSVVCSAVLGFKAKLVDAPDGKKLGDFRSDVWVEFPHCLSFGGYSLKDYSTAFVVSERRGKVEVEEQALFSEGYPYVNLPVRQFCKFCVAHLPKRRFRVHMCTTKRQVAVSRVKKAMKKVDDSESISNEPSASPCAHSRQQKQRMMEPSTSVNGAGERSGYVSNEKKKTRSKGSVDNKRQAFIHQDSSGNHSVDAVDVYQPAPVSTASCATLQQEPLNTASVSVMACVCQPVGRHKMERWTAEIIFAPLLHKALKELAKCQNRVKHEICAVSFRLDVRLQLIQLHSEPSSIQEWSVELSTKEILLEHFTVVAQFLKEDTTSTTMSTFLPKSLVTVHNKGASLPLHHPVTVEGSWPTAHCYLTCQVRPQSVKRAGGKPMMAQTLKPNVPTEHHLQNITASDANQDATQEPHPPTPPTIEWERDRYVLALLSIMVPEDQLVTLGDYLGLSHLKTDQVMSGYTAGSALNVGERAYEMFRHASRSEQALTFGKVLVGLDEIGRSDDLVPILRRYIQSELMSQSIKADSPGAPAEANSEFLPSVLFMIITWLHAHDPTLLPCVSLPGVAKDRVILPEEQGALFIGLSRRMVFVWRMVGRLLGLPDYEIEAADIEGRRSGDRECESCYQLLLKWVEYSRPSDVTYYRLMTALEMTSLGGGAALDATFYLNHFVLHLTSAS